MMMSAAASPHAAIIVTMHQVVFPALVLQASHWLLMPGLAMVSYCFISCTDMLVYTFMCIKIL